jgi:hypothetical protein
MTVFGRFAEFRIGLYTNQYGEETIGDPDYHARLLRSLGAVAVENMAVAASQGLAGLIAKPEWNRRERQRLCLYLLPLLALGAGGLATARWRRGRRGQTLAVVLLASVTLPLLARGVAGPPDIRVTFGEGFYGEERDGGAAWSWARDRGTLIVPPAGPPAGESGVEPWGWDLQFQISGLKPCHVWMKVGDEPEQLVLRPDDGMAEIRRRLPPGDRPTLIELRSDLPAVQPGNGDTRALSFRLHNPRIRRIRP